MGFPLPAPSLDASWPTLKRNAKVSLSVAELELLSAIPLPTASERDSTLTALAFFWYGKSGGTQRLGSGRARVQRV